ncbi:PTS system, glucose subfamily, IIA component [Thomasclavelia ramosa DSM 1402]|uniref:PTS system, glucose subfamily, IIA component n=2 Tax=Thomasclavelia ramosa TaxID=1547 RepID=B0N3B7_9FIRM|nr:PTS system, glucose subfamily, IIA component [Thomasclavelia ramosa DSM 1402]
MKIMGLFNKWKKKVEVEPYRISAPVAGKVIDIKDTNDQVFNSEALGKGVGIIASEKQITAPIGGQIVSFFPTKHAVGIKTDKGVELLIHVGIDTVELNGKHFISMKKQGDTVVRGDILLKVDFDAIREAGYDPTVLMVVTNTAQYAQIKCNLGNKSNNDIIIEIEE